MLGRELLKVKRDYHVMLDKGYADIFILADGTKLLSVYEENANAFTEYVFYSDNRPAEMSELVVGCMRTEWHVWGLSFAETFAMEKRTAFNPDDNGWVVSV